MLHFLMSMILILAIAGMVFVCFYIVAFILAVLIVCVIPRSALIRWQNSVCSFFGDIANDFKKWAEAGGRIDKKTPPSAESK